VRKRTVLVIPKAALTEANKLCAKFSPYARNTFTVKYSSNGVTVSHFVASWDLSKEDLARLKTIIAAQIGTCTFDTGGRGVLKAKKLRPVAATQI